MRFLNTFLAIITVTCFSFYAYAGDKHDDKELFNRVSVKLEKGGSYFNFQSNKYLFRAVEYSYLQIPEAIKVIAPNQQQQMIPMIVYNALKPIVKNLGIDEMLAAGASSILIREKTDKSQALFRSRQFIYYGDKKPKGIIWDLSSGENHELSSLATLPKETLFASSSQSVPGEIWKKVKVIFLQIPFPMVQSIAVMAEQNFFNKFNIKLPDFLDSLNGTYSSILVSATAANGNPALYAMLKIPNKNDLVFQVLAKLAKTQPYLQVLPDEISPTTPPILSWLKPAVRKDDKNLYIVSNPKILEIVKNTTENKDGLITTAEFKSLSVEMAKKGIAFCYFNSRTIKVIIDTIKANAPGSEDKDWSILAKLIPPSDLFLVVSKEKDGIMATMNSPMDIPLIVTYSSIMPSVLQFAKLLPALGQARSKARRISCSSNLKQIGLALKMYAMDHKDKYPAGNNTVGLNKLIKEDYLTDLNVYVCPNSKIVKGAKELKEANSSYIYIGDFVEGDGADIPVAFDKFGNQRGFINILFQDGHVTGMPSNVKSCKELIAHLAKRSKFKAEVLKKLQEKAVQIDKELGYK